MRRLAYSAWLLLWSTGLALAQPVSPSVTTTPQPGVTWLQAGIQANLKTYKYSSLGNTPAATPTDVIWMQGSASRTIRIQRITVGGIAGTAGQLNPLLIRRSAVDTAGTCTTPALQQHDTSDAAATAVINLCTANPTPGTTVGTVASCRLFLQTATGGSPDICAFTFGINNDRALVLRGATDVLAINFAGAAVPASGLLDFDIEWTEDP